MEFGALQRTKTVGILDSDFFEEPKNWNRRFFIESNNRATPVVSSQHFVII